MYDLKVKNLYGKNLSKANVFKKGLLMSDANSVPATAAQPPVSLGYIATAGTHIVSLPADFNAPSVIVGTELKLALLPSKYEAGSPAVSYTHLTLPTSDLV